MEEKQSCRESRGQRRGEREARNEGEEGAQEGEESATEREEAKGQAAYIGRRRYGRDSSKRHNQRSLGRESRESTRQIYEPVRPERKRED